MTRRLAMLLLGGLVQNLRVQTPQKPTALVIHLDDWTTWTVEHKGERVTFTADELFAALKEQP